VSLGAFRPATSTDGRVPQPVLRLAGLLLLIVAGLRIQSMGVEPWMPTQASVAQVKESLASVSLLKQKELLDRALTWAPLDWQLYDRRALVYMNLPGSMDESDHDFNLALYLEQNSIELPVSIGEVCRRTNFPEALLAWKALLQRAGPRREDLFEYLYAGLTVKAKLEATALAGDDPNLEAISVLSEDSPEFDWLLQNLLESNPSLKGVNPPLLKKLFDRWVKVGNVEQFMNNWPLHPEWRDSGWSAFAKGLAQGGRFKEAVNLVLQLMPVPQVPDFDEPQNLEEAARQYRYNPQDPLTGIRLYFAQVSAGMNDQAMDTLTEVARLPNPPDYVRYLLAKNLANTDQSEAAWRTLEPLLNEG